MPVRADLSSVVIVLYNYSLTSGVATIQQDHHLAGFQTKLGLAGRCENCGKGTYNLPMLVLAQIAPTEVAANYHEWVEEGEY